jgi:hypothetical protein
VSRAQLLSQQLLLDLLAEGEPGAAPQLLLRSESGVANKN